MSLPEGHLKIGPGEQTLSIPSAHDSEYKDNTITYLVLILCISYFIQKHHQFCAFIGNVLNIFKLGSLDILKPMETYI